MKLLKGACLGMGKSNHEKREGVAGLKVSYVKGDFRLFSGSASAFDGGDEKA